jgi:hypothetical protein
MELVHEFDYHATLKPPVEIGGPTGTRMFFEVTGEGRLEGERIKARVLTGGGDWLLMGSDGRGRLDVRAQIETDDGAVVYVEYHGILELNDAVQHAMATASGTDFGDQYFRTTPRFHTGDERYAWLNESVFVAEGRVYPGLGVEYRVYRVA